MSPVVFSKNCLPANLVLVVRQLELQLLSDWRVEIDQDHLRLENHHPLVQVPPIEVRDCEVLLLQQQCHKPLKVLFGYPSLNKEIFFSRGRSHFLYKSFGLLTTCNWNVFFQALEDGSKVSWVVVRLGTHYRLEKTSNKFLFSLFCKYKLTI